jgi:hypothetical protein
LIRGEREREIESDERFDPFSANMSKNGILTTIEVVFEE